MIARNSLGIDSPAGPVDRHIVACGAADCSGTASVAAHRKAPPGELVSCVSQSAASATHITESVYRNVIVATIRWEATVLDSVFGDENEESA